MNDLLITIGRENGSGGREVGKIIADKLGINYYDQEIISTAAKETGLSKEEIAKEEERNKNTPFYFWGVSAPNPVFEAQSKAIEDLSKNGSAVFVGRCADYVLNGHPHAVNVFIHAPIDKRIERSMSRNNISSKAAAERVQKKDSERAAYYQRYTGKIWGTVGNYHLSVDTGPIGTENAAEIIIEYIKKMGYLS